MMEQSARIVRSVDPSTKRGLVEGALRIDGVLENGMASECLVQFASHAGDKSCDPPFVKPNPFAVSAGQADKPFAFAAVNDAHSLRLLSSHHLWHSRGVGPHNTGNKQDFGSFERHSHESL